MKKSLYILVAASTAAMLLASCAKEVESVPTDDNNGPVYITASIDLETKSTLNDGTGAFAFSNGDAIKVCNESGAYSGTTTSTENSGKFAMEAGFNGSTDGIAGFPASIVSAMTSSSVTFTLPASYDYSAVGSGDPVTAEGGDAAASTAKVPCPMIGSYNGTTKEVTLKQAGSVVRFRVTNVAAGSLSFTFPTKVTGEVKPIGVPDGDSDGILATNFKNSAGNTITVSDVPTVTEDYFIYITIPVPTGTAPQNILVTNTPSGAGADKFQNLSGSSVPLYRAQGWKLGVSPSITPSTPSFTVNDHEGKVVLAPGNLMARIESIDVINDDGVNVVVGTASSWKFGGAYEFVGSASGAACELFANGNDDCIGQWIDLFSWQGNSVSIENRYQGIVSTPYDRSRKSATPNPETSKYDAPCATDIPAWHGDVVNEDLYAGCWTTDINNSSSPTDGKIYISNGGDYTWRVLSKDEWNYILTERETGELNGTSHARFSRATVSGMNGLLIFPDNINDALWETTGIATKPKDINCQQAKYDSKQPNYIEYSGADMIAMANIGIVFLPNAGCASGPSMLAYNTIGYYWTNSGSKVNARDKGEYGAWYINVHYTQNTSVAQYARNASRSVRLARDI